jgi:hypothetical protein
MNKSSVVRFFFLIFGLSILVSACSVNIERNPDGSMSIETAMQEAALEAEIQAAIADPLMENFTVDLQNGYILVSADRKRLNSNATDNMSFRLDLGAADGHMTALISDATINDFPINEDRLALWNQRIATKLERAGQRNPDSTLINVTTTNETVTMFWRVETAQSRPN